MPAGHEHEHEHGRGHGNGHGNGTHDGHIGHIGHTGYDSHSGHDSHSAQDSHDDSDPLMAALLDVPLSEEARADPALLAAHRAATADVALLRAQLGLVADALTRPAPAPAPAPASVRPPRRRLLTLALRTAAVAAAGALVVGSGWLVVQVGRGADDIGASSGADKSVADGGAAASGAAGDLFGDPGYLACARLVVEGDVTHVDRVPGTTRERVTLRVTRSYKPAAGGQDEVGFLTGDGAEPLLAEGDHVLVGFARGSASPDAWAVGEDGIAAGRSALARALPEAGDTAACE
ncbi:hypothetical protein [Streptomyces sp. NPDC088812]|uniref:hypothetical protein n=1 Tax=Streptomyces sp. NPDC088812 TaxID=3365905 RepID=UPI0038066367